MSASMSDKAGEQTAQTSSASLGINGYTTNGESIDVPTKRPASVSSNTLSSPKIDRPQKRIRAGRGPVDPREYAKSFGSDGKVMCLRIWHLFGHANLPIFASKMDDRYAARSFNINARARLRLLIRDEDKNRVEEAKKLVNDDEMSAANTHREDEEDESSKSDLDDITDKDFEIEKKRRRSTRTSYVPGGTPNRSPHPAFFQVEFQARKKNCNTVLGEFRTIKSNATAIVETVLHEIVELRAAKEQDEAKIDELRAAREQDVIKIKHLESSIENYKLSFGELETPKKKQTPGQDQKRLPMSNQPEVFKIHPPTVINSTWEALRRRYPILDPAPAF